MEMAANVCLSEAQMSLGGTPFESMLSRFIFPPVFLIGILGNAMNLCVLLSATMRNRANNLLSAMAFADITFLLFMLPHSLANYSFFALSYTFRWLYFHSKSEIVALANWSSAAAIWFVLAVCIDRLYGIKSPLYSCREWSSKRMTYVLIGICIATGVLTSYYHIAYDCYQIDLCNGTQLHSVCLPVAAETWLKNKTNPHPYWMRSYIRIGTVANALLVIIIPVFALVALNMALVHALKQRAKEPLLVSPAGPRRASDGAVQRKQERKVAVTVSSIVCCFTLTQGPSAVMMVWNMANGFKSINSPTLYDLNSAANFLVTIGKSSNFFLFCLSSSNFRLRLLHLLKRRAEVFSHKSNYFPNRASDTTTTLITSPRYSLQLVPAIEPMRSRASSFCPGTKSSPQAIRSIIKIRSLDSTDL